MPLVLILHNIRSVHNVGSIFRTADAAGVSRIILSGYTPTPLDRFNQPRKDLAKVALGAEKSVPWDVSRNLGRTLEKLKKEGFSLAALEQDARSTPLFSYTPEPSTPIALLVGNEVRGVSAPLRNKMDVLLEIPMRGKKESLNVSVATGIALFALLRAI